MIQLKTPSEPPTPEKPEIKDEAANKVAKPFSASSENAPKPLASAQKTSQGNTKEKPQNEGHSQDEDTGSGLPAQLLYKFNEIRQRYPKQTKYALIGSGVFLVGLPIVYNLGQFAYNEYTLHKGETFFEDKNFQDAEKHLSTYYRIHPEDTDVATTLAKTYFYLQQYENAQPLIDTIISQTGGNSPDIWYYNALIDLSTEEKGSFTNKVDQGIKIDNDNFSLHLLKAGASHYLLENSQQAELYFKKSLEISKSMDSSDLAEISEQISFLRSLFFSIYQNNVSSAPNLPFAYLSDTSPLLKEIGFDIPASAFHNAYFIPPKDPDIVTDTISPLDSIHILRAIVSIDSDNYSEALDNMDLVENKDSILYRFLRGYIAAAEGDFQLASETYAGIVSDYPSNSNAHTLLGNSLWALSEGHFPSEQVLNSYKKALELNSKDLVAAENLSFLELYLGNVDEASEKLKIAKSLSASSPYANYSSALLNIVNNRLDEALVELFSLVEVYSDSDFIFNTLAQVLVKQEKYAEAIDVLRRVIEIAPTPVLYLEISRLHDLRPQPLLAIYDLLKAQEIYPDNQEILAELALRQAHQKDKKEVEKLLTKATFDLNSNYRTLIALALLESDKQKAGELFQKAVRLSPTALEKNRSLIFWGEHLIDTLNPSEKEVKSLIALAEEVRKSENGFISENLQFLLHWAEVVSIIESDSDEKIASVEEKIENIINSPSFNETASRNIYLAWALYHLGAPRAAIDIANKVTDSDVNVSRLLSILEISYEKVGDKKNLDDIRRRIASFKDVQNRNQDSTSSSDSSDSSEKKKKKVAIFKGNNELTKQIDSALKKGDLEKAIELYTDIIDSDQTGDPAVAYQNRGVLYLNVKDFQKAANDLDKALSFKTLSEDKEKVVLYNYSYALLNTKEHLKAIQQLEKLLSNSSPGEEKIRYLILMASAQESLKKTEDLISTYSEILSISPSQVQIYPRLGRAYRTLNQLDKAIDILNKGLQIDSKNKSIHTALAEVYTFKGNNKKAKEHLDLAKQL